MSQPTRYTEAQVAHLFSLECVRLQALTDTIKNESFIRISIMKEAQKTSEIRLENELERRMAKEEAVAETLIEQMKKNGISYRNGLEDARIDRSADSEAWRARMRKESDEKIRRKLIETARSIERKDEESLAKIEREDRAMEWEWEQGVHEDGEWS